MRIFVSNLLISGVVQFIILKLYVTTGIAKVSIASMQFAELNSVFRIARTLR